MIYITKYTQLSKLVQYLSSNHMVAFDIETTGLNPYTNEVLLVQLKIKDEIFIINWKELEKYRNYICELLEPHLLVGHNIKFDIKFIYTNTKILFKNLFDTQIAERIITNGIAEGEEKYPSLEDICLKYLNIKLNKEIRKKFYEEEIIEITQDLLNYSAEDVNYIFELKEIQEKIILEQKQEKVLSLENKLIPVTASMELEGVSLDLEKWSKLGVDNETEADKIGLEISTQIIDDVLKEKKFENALEAFEFLNITSEFKTKKAKEILVNIRDLSFIRETLIKNLNLGSNKQVLNILQNIYKIGRTTRNGFEPIPNTNEKVINKYDHPIIKKLISFREAEKKTTGFGEKFSRRINEVTGNIHTEFNQLGADSGRYSSSNPNLCNIPRDEKYRSCFIAKEGHKIISLDFSQEELRLLSLFEPKMAQAYKEGKDLHAATASWIFGVPYEEVTKDQRFVGKSMNFAVGYGSTEYGLLKNFNIPLEKGKEYLDKYYNQAYTGLRDFKEVAGDAILERGYSKTLGGRKRFFNKRILFEGGARDKESWEARIKREGINHIIQGTGADVIKQSLVDIFYNNPFGEDLKLIIQVYDEIVCLVKDEIVDDAYSYVESIMLKNLQKYLGEIPAIVEGHKNAYWTK